MALTKILEEGIKDGEIVNADINASAAIAKTKLASLDIVNADINASAAIAKTKLASLDIVNADINASAAIATSKITGLATSATTDTTNASNIGSGSLANARLTKPIDFADSEQARFGTGNDFTIVHDGTNTVLDNNTGQFNIDGASGSAIRFLNNGNYQCQIGSAGLDLPDTKKIRLGDSEDLELQHDGTNNIIKTSTAAEIQINNGNEYMARFIPNGAAELYHDNVKKAHTYSDGFKVDGYQRNIRSGYNYLLIGSNDASGVSIGLDGDSNGDGAGADYAYIEHGTDGDLSIHCDNPAGDSQFELYVGSGSTTAIIAQAAGETQLYHNGGLKLNTDTYGIDVTGTSSVNAHVKIHGNNCLGRSYWGYSTGYSGTVLGRTDNSVGSTIFMGVDVTGNSSGSFGGQGNEIVFRNDHAFKTPNAANNNYVTPLRFGRATSTEGAVNFPQGLMFGADQADANILDDYEEGTFTPDFNAGSSSGACYAGGLSYTKQLGFYRKIGNVVYFLIKLQVSSGTLKSGILQINSLPITSGNLGSNDIAGSAYFAYTTGYFNDTANLPMAWVSPSSSYIQFYNTAGNNFAGSHLAQAAGRMDLWGFYFTS